MQPLGSSDDSYAVIALIVVMALIEVVLLAGPAFAVSARKQQRSLALMAATGGTPKQSRRVIVASALVLGSVAAVVGVALGIGAARLFEPLLQTRSDDWFGPFEVPWLHLVGVAGFGCSARSWPPWSRPTWRPGRTSSRCWPAAAGTGRRP